MEDRGTYGHVSSEPLLSEQLLEDYESSGDIYGQPALLKQMSTRKQNKYETVDLTRVKESWYKYRAYCIPLSRMFDWESPHYPASALASITLIFLIILIAEPSVLTAASFFLIIVSCLDYAADSISDRLYPSDQWGEVEDVQFESVVSRVAGIRGLVCNTVSTLAAMRIEKPSVYIMIMVGLLLVMAWIGSIMDNLFMLYIFVVLCFLLPGLRKYEVSKLITDKIVELVRRVKSKLEDTKKE